MDRPLTNTEFFTYEGEVWYRDGVCEIKQLRETDTKVIDELLEHVATFYPKAYAALIEEYKACALNRPYCKFRMATRFIRCNFAQLDNIPDFTGARRCNFEYVQCPLRGECRCEHIICRPEFDHKLSAAEMRVLRLWYEGYAEEDIAAQLYLSQYTVHNHIRNAYQRLDIHSKSEFVKYAAAHNLFT